jgi:molecular chaperone GrpE
MAFGKSKRTETESDPVDEQPEAAAVGEERAQDEELQEEDPLEAARRERDEATERLMRLQADFQNHRRHAQANIDSAVTSARSEVLGEAVTILDYLDMALAMEVESEEAKNLKIGVEMTRQQLQGLLDRMGVKAIDATGAFDPAVHQAVSTVETDEHEPGTIVEVVRGGWTMGEAVLRFAQVRVAAAPEGEPEMGTEMGTEAGAEGNAGSDAPVEDAAEGTA